MENCLESKEEYYAIDIFKLIFGLAVVAIHIDPLVSLEGSIIYKIYKSFIYLAVPFFFTTTGFLVGERLKYCEPCKELQLLKVQIFKYIKLYLIWTAVYMPLAVWNYIYTGMNVRATIKHFIFGILWLGENYNSFILWYLLSSIYSFVFIFLLRKMECRYKYIFVIGTIIGICAIFLVDYKNGIIEFSGNMGILFRKISNIGGRVFTGFFYIPLGIMLNKIGIVSKKISLGCIAIGFALEVISPGCGEIYELGRGLAIIGLILFLFKIKLPDGEQYKVFRNLSTSLYYWHLLIYTILCFIFFGMGNMRKGFVIYIATILIIIVGDFIMSLIVNRNFSKGDIK